MEDNNNDEGKSNVEPEKINWKDALREHFKNNPPKFTHSDEEGDIPVWSLNLKDMGLLPIQNNETLFVFDDNSGRISPEMMADFLKEIKDIRDNTPESNPKIIVDSNLIVNESTETNNILEKVKKAIDSGVSEDSKKDFLGELNKIREKAANLTPSIDNKNKPQ